MALKAGPIDELTIEMLDAIFNSDLRSSFYMIKTALPYMQKDKRDGSIINIGSMASCCGALGSAAYASAKAGVDVLTNTVALQYGKDNVRCNCIRPGLIVTPDNEDRISQALKDIVISNIEVNRRGQPTDIGSACAYFASDESAYVTGQIITVDGGLNSYAPTVAQFRAMGPRTW